MAFWISDLDQDCLVAAIAARVDLLSDFDPVDIAHPLFPRFILTIPRPPDLLDQYGHNQPVSPKNQKRLPITVQVDLQHRCY